MSSSSDGSSPPGRGRGVFRGRGRVAGVGTAPVGRGETTPAARIVGRARGRGRAAIASQRSPGNSGQLPMVPDTAIAASPSLVGDVEESTSSEYRNVLRISKVNTGIMRHLRHLCFPLKTEKV